MAYKIPILISYAYAKDNLEDFAEIANHPSVDVLLDSGACTAANAGKGIKLDEYCEFLDQWGDKVFRYLALDVVGNPEGTESNLREMIAAGYKPVPVHVLGDDQRRMDELFEMSDYVALAGLRRPHKGHCPPAYVKAKMKWAAGRNVHWLGYTKESMISAFKPFSADSANWSASQQWGHLHLYIGNGQWIWCRYHNRDRARNHAALQDAMRRFGYDIAMFDDSRCWKYCNPNKSEYKWTDFLSMGITADSWIRYAIDLYKHCGTRLFLATGLDSDKKTKFVWRAIQSHENKIVDLV